MLIRARLFHAVLLLSTVLSFTAISSAQHYTRTDLTADTAATSATAAHTDANLVNAWGLSRGSTSFWWVSDNGTGLSTLYDAAGTPQSLVVSMAKPDGVDSSAPTGTVFNYAGFEAAPGFRAAFVFCTEEGTITAWSPGASPTVALLRANNHGRAVYKGCAIAGPANAAMLYATNFQTGAIDVFDSKFNQVSLGHDAFRLRGESENERGDDRHGLVWVPFNIQNVGGNLVVTYARKAPGATDETAGAGFGRVVIYAPNGRRIRELQTGPWLNAPWGIAMSPSDFGTFSHRILIGNFGDGTIHAYNAETGRYEGALLAADNTTLHIDGLWALSFGGSNARNGNSFELFFTAGPNDESNGLFGKITPAAAEQRGNTE